MNNIDYNSWKWIYNGVYIEYDKKHKPNYRTTVDVIAVSKTGHVCKCEAQLIHHIFREDEWLFVWTNPFIRPHHVRKWKYKN